MNWGALRELFRGVAWKRLTPHEVDPAVSNGHEFQGINRLRDLLGSEPRRDVPTTYFIFDDSDDGPEPLRSTSSWYDARAKDPSRSSEWRLYYPADAGVLQSRMHPGDLMVIAVLESSELAVLLAPRDSLREAQLATLFGIDIADARTMQTHLFEPSDGISFAAGLILEELGLRPLEPRGPDHDVASAIAKELIEAHGKQLPRGDILAALVQQRASDVDPRADPDAALQRWVELQWAVADRWRDEIIGQRILDGFLLPDGNPDVKSFLAFNMSMRQSRASRAGGALQYHTERVLTEHGVAFQAQVITENGEKPDFLFPDAKAYRDMSFPDAELRMLAVKFTLKDRWRQVLNEAARIRPKHLLTMDAAISESGLRAMAAASLQIVVPADVRRSYTQSMQHGLLSVRELLELLPRKGR